MSEGIKTSKYSSDGVKIYDMIGKVTLRLGTSPIEIVFTLPPDSKFGSMSDRYFAFRDGIRDELAAYAKAKGVDQSKALNDEMSEEFMSSVKGIEERSAEFVNEITEILEHATTLIEARLVEHVTEDAEEAEKVITSKIAEFKKIIAAKMAEK